MRLLSSVNWKRAKEEDTPDGIILEELRELGGEPGLDEASPEFGRAYGMFEHTKEPKVEAKSALSREERPMHRLESMD